LIAVIPQVTGSSGFVFQLPPTSMSKSKFITASILPEDHREIVAGHVQYRVFQQNDLHGVLFALMVLPTLVFSWLR
jgi:hypothetical protein